MRPASRWMRKRRAPARDSSSTSSRRIPRTGTAGVRGWAWTGDGTTKRCSAPARALIQEGETEAAKPYVGQALKINPKLGRIYFFKALIEKADGKYDDALKSLDTTLGMYPRDRVALNQAARILFLERKYAEALKYLDRVCDVDPEDLQMHYTRMLCLRGLGDAAGAGREQALFQRFKAEESAQAITAKPRLLSPENNNERQQIHDHESVPLNVSARTPKPVLAAAGGAQ